jgi:catechol 2,3-dioxygenase-like lactoylglutathione lyase family enzyme
MIAIETLHHVSVTVTDLERAKRFYAGETRAHLEAAGIPFDDRPRNRTPWPQVYVTDPDGNLIELNSARLD